MEGAQVPAGTGDAPVTGPRESQVPNATDAITLPGGESTGAEGRESVAAPGTAQPPARTPEQPDISSLLQNPDTRKFLVEHPEVRKALLEHPEIKADFERIKSAAGRKARQEFQDWLAHQKAQAEAAAAKREILEGDPTELGEKVQARARQNEQLEGMALGIYRQVGLELHEGIKGLDDLSDEDKQVLDPTNTQYSSFFAFFDDASKRRAKVLADREIKRRLPIEVEAGVKERLATLRAEEPRAPDLGPSMPSASDADFVRSVANSRTSLSGNDLARSKKLLEDMGINL